MAGPLDFLAMWLQAIVEGLQTPSTTVAYAAAIVFIVFVVYWYWRHRQYWKDPTPYRFGDYHLRMPHLAETNKVTVFGLDVRLSENVLDMFADVISKQPRAAELAGGNGNAGERKNVVKEALEKHKDKHFYLLRHLYTEGTKKSSGYSILMTNIRLEEGGNYTELEEHRNALAGTETRIRSIRDSLDTGIVFKFGRDHNRRWRGKHPVDLIYYPFEPIKTGTQLTSKQIETVEGLMSVVTQLDVVVPTLKQTKYNQELARERGRTLNKALNRLLRVVTRMDNMAIATTTEGYDSNQRTIEKQGFNWLVAAAMMAAGALLGPPIFKQLDPTWTDTAYTLFGLFSAFLLTVAAAWWTKRRK